MDNNIKITSKLRADSKEFIPINLYCKIDNNIKITSKLRADSKEFIPIRLKKLYYKMDCILNQCVILFPTL